MKISASVKDQEFVFDYENKISDLKDELRFSMRYYESF